MARFVATVNTPWSPAKAFAYMADATNFEAWDPGVTSARRVVGDEPGLGTEFDVTVKTVGSGLTLRYKTTRFEPPTDDGDGVVLLEANHHLMTSVDLVTITARDGGSVVTYDADLHLNSVWKLFSPLLALSFQRIGERAAAGLVRGLDGERVTA